MRRLIREGRLSYTEIANETRASVASVASYAKRWGAPSRAQSALKRYQAIQELVAQVGQAEAARQLGLSRQRVHFVMAKLAEDSDEAQSQNHGKP